MTTDGVERAQHVEALNRVQLEIYAKELREHFHEERRLRQELEGRNQQMEARLRELTALNRLFQQHLAERDAAVEGYRDLLSRVEWLSRETASIADHARQRPILESGAAPKPRS